MWVGMMAEKMVARTADEWVRMMVGRKVAMMAVKMVE